MNIEIEELFRGKSTLIKNKEYLDTRSYVEPFINKMSNFTSDFRVKVKLPNQTTITGDKADITYNRVLIEAVLPEKHCIDKHDEVVGFLYGLDVRKPVVKIYRSYLNQACTNMCVFNPDWIRMQELQPDKALDYNVITNLMENTNDFGAKLKKLKSSYVDRDDNVFMLGEWVDMALKQDIDLGQGKVKLATGVPITAYKNLYVNEESDYFIPKGMDPTLFDIYNAFTQVFTDQADKDFMNIFEKVLLVNQFLKI